MGAASVAALVLSGLSFATPAHAEGEVPILGQAWTTSNEDTAETRMDVVISVHGVRRVEGATMVYWSVGYTPDSTSGSDFRQLVMAFGSGSSLSPPRSGTEFMGDVAVIDLPGRKAYTTLYKGDTVYDCLCNTWTQILPEVPEPGTAYVNAAALPQIPGGMDTVTVRVAGQIIPDVPVEDGPMLPIAKEWPIPVGKGWPRVKTDAINDIEDPSAFIVPLTTHKVIEDSALSERSDAESRSLDLSADVLFEVDEATLSGKAKREIKAAAKTVKEADATGTLRVTGHTDSSGEAGYNQSLSTRRAESVAKALEPLLPSGVRLTTSGRGESEPIASNETDEGKTLNRRVTITLPKEQ